jgi:high-affinity Fe2+/Pb2+ permease
MENTTSSQAMSVKDWLITLIIGAIPGVGLIMLFVWGFGSDENQIRANWAKAMLILVAAGIVLSFMFLGAFLSFIMALAGKGGY